MDFHFLKSHYNGALGLCSMPLYKAQDFQEFRAPTDWNVLSKWVNEYHLLLQVLCTISGEKTIVHCTLCEIWTYYEW